MGYSLIFENDDLADMMCGLLMWSCSFFVVNAAFALAYLCMGG